MLQLKFYHDRPIRSSKADESTARKEEDNSSDQPEALKRNRAHLHEMSARNADIKT